MNLFKFFSFELELSFYQISNRKVTKNVNPYLVEGNDLVIEKRAKSLCKVNPIKYGSIAIDNGFLILNEDDNDFNNNIKLLEKIGRAHV